jgi:hypothetical protein
MHDILFVFGSARGGTTFLSQVLTEFFSYGMGPEGTFVKKIVKKAKQLGDLSSDEKCYELAEEIVNTETFQIIQTRWGEEARFAVSPEDIMARMPDRTVSSAIFAAYKVMADKLHMRRVGNKNPGYWRELDTLNALFPQNAKYLFIVRDGRDVALSLKNVPWGGHSVYAAASIWKNMIATVRKFEKEVRPGALLTIRYEDLLNNPGDTIASIGNFVGQDDMIQIRANYEKATQDNQLRSNFGKWTHDMSIEDQQTYEAIAGSALTEFGYECRYPHARIGAWQRLIYQVREWLRKIRVNMYHLLSHLPLDTRKSKKNTIAELVQPGRKNRPK